MITVVNTCAGKVFARIWAGSSVSGDVKSELTQLTRFGGAIIT